jgi:hypothetical protein
MAKSQRQVVMDKLSSSEMAIRDLVRFLMNNITCIYEFPCISHV